MHTLLLPKMTVKGYFKKGLYLQGQNERGRNSKFMEAWKQMNERYWLNRPRKPNSSPTVGKAEVFTLQSVWKVQELASPGPLEMRLKVGLKIGLGGSFFKKQLNSPLHSQAYSIP